MVVLNEIQSEIGFISESVQHYVAAELKIPASVVHGVVTFYSFFTTTPRGKHTIKFCMGTACYVGGTPQLLEKAKQVLGIEPGETTEDGMITIELCRCVGACSQAPVLTVDEEVYDVCAPINSRNHSQSSGKRQRRDGRRLRELALHLLDIAENSIGAKAKNIVIRVEKDTETDRLRMSVLDDGVGMDPEMVARVTDPFTTSRTTRKVGLGIPLLKAAAEACNGWLEIQSTPGKGTSVKAEFQYSHIDRMPLGGPSETYLSLVLGAPQIHWLLTYKVDGKEFVFDDEPIKKNWMASLLQNRR